MRSETAILCGESRPPKGVEERDAVRLDLNSNVVLKVSDIRKVMVANVSPVMLDLLEIATYVYCADQATTRGGGTSREYGENWRRRFRFHIPVREPDHWRSKGVLAALGRALGFLSEDEYTFSFTKLKAAPAIERYLDYSSEDPTGFQADEVVLFSGGLDSLAGALQECVVDRRRIALVSHRSVSKISNKQLALVRDLRELADARALHVPVWVNKEKALGKEYTQRSRSFLYASLAAVVARTFGLKGIRFYENGVVSINLPISPQVVGARATRTTHPQVLNGFTDFFSTLFQAPFTVENPFLWKTKSDIVRSIRSSGGSDFIKHTVSCTHTWEMTTLLTHCGTCSQCIDRRFATLSSGCGDTEDPEEMYGVDLLTGPRPRGDARTMLESYVAMAKAIRDMSEHSFFSTFGELHRVTREVRGTSVDTTAGRIFALYRRHATEVCDVITKGIETHAKDITEGALSPDSLLILALPEQYRRPGLPSEPDSQPALMLKEIKDGQSNKGLLARVEGAGRFDGVNKKIGARELFFIHALFEAERVLDYAGERITVVTESEVCRRLLEWRDNGYLRFSGKDAGKPTYRVQKMWHEFVRQLEKDANFKNLFTDAHRDLESQRLYGVRLRPRESQILVSSIQGLFNRAADGPKGSSPLASRGPQKSP